ncbi:MAG: rod shape-determining protein [Clostridia bacterium]|nr:rod shape-determining protein [Clostridia bacterium]
MKNNSVAILDFGSSKITCMLANKVSDGGDFIIKAVGRSNYNGFDDKGWYEPDTIKKAVFDAITQVENKTETKIKEIYVGVPGAFCAVASSESSITFRSKKKLDSQDVEDLISKADIFDCGSDLAPLGGKPVYFVLDGGIKCFDIVGNIATKVSALVSFSFMKNYFRQTVAPILLEKGIKKVTYVNSCEAQAMYISNALYINGYSIVVDIGHITTNVSLVGGKGLLFARTFALGSGYLASDLMQVMGLDYNFAMNVLTKINLNLDIHDGDAYSVNGRMVDAKRVNEVVKARVEQIAEHIIKSFRYCDKEIPSNTVIVLTGGGLTYIRGGADTLATSLGKPVKVYTSANPQTNHNEYTSCFGLIHMACSDQKRAKKSLFSIFKRTNKGDN